MSLESELLTPQAKEHSDNLAERRRQEIEAMTSAWNHSTTDHTEARAVHKAREEELEIIHNTNEQFQAFINSADNPSWARSACRSMYPDPHIETVEQAKVKYDKICDQYLETQLSPQQRKDLAKQKQKQEKLNQTVQGRSKLLDASKAWHDAVEQRRSVREYWANEERKMLSAFNEARTKSLNEWDAYVSHLRAAFQLEKNK